MVELNIYFIKNYNNYNYSYSVNVDVNIINYKY